MMDGLRQVAVLCCSRNSVYKSLAGVDCYDKKRGAESFSGGMPIIAHPPCRGWSAYCRHQAKVEPGELELGKSCASILKQCGGVLEQPAHSRLFEVASLPKPGAPCGPDLFSIEVLQAWWGYPMRKATWLCFSGIDIDSLVIPKLDHDSRGGLGDRRRQQLMSKNQRAATNVEFAQWLLDVARSSRFPSAEAAA